VLHAKDLTSDQEVRWCPGCGDFSILSAFKKVLASCGVPRERIAVVSGLGCSSSAIVWTMGERVPRR